MADYSRPDFPQSRFVREHVTPEETPTAFALQAPTIAGHVDLELYRNVINALSKDGLNDYNNNNYMSGDIEYALGIYESHKRPAFSEAFWTLAQQMVALAASSTDNFDRLQPTGHKVRINAADYTPWYKKEHEESWKKSYWKQRLDPIIVASSEATVDFVVGEIPVDNEELIYQYQYQMPTLFGKRWKTNPKRTRHSVGVSSTVFEKLSDEQLIESGLTIITLEPGQVAVAGLGEWMRRRGKHEPGTGYVELKFSR
jgi:hypothetical protein